MKNLNNSGTGLISLGLIQHYLLSSHLASDTHWLTLISNIALTVLCIEQIAAFCYFDLTKILDLWGCIYSHDEGLGSCGISNKLTHLRPVFS